VSAVSNNDQLNRDAAWEWLSESIFSNCMASALLLCTILAHVDSLSQVTGNDIE